MDAFAEDVTAYLNGKKTGDRYRHYFNCPGNLLPFVERFKEDLFNMKILVIGIIAFAVLALTVMIGSFLTEEFIEKLRN